LVFLDVQMPGLDGFGVLKKLVERKMKNAARRICHGVRSVRRTSVRGNAVDYILKPFDKSRIAKAIQRARKMMETQTNCGGASRATRQPALPPQNSIRHPPR